MYNHQGYENIIFIEIMKPLCLKIRIWILKAATGLKDYHWLLAFMTKPAWITSFTLATLRYVFTDLIDISTESDMIVGKFKIMVKKP